MPRYKVTVRMPCYFEYIIHAEDDLAAEEAALEWAEDGGDPVDSDPDDAEVSEIIELEDEAKSPPQTAPEAPSK